MAQPDLIPDSEGAGRFLPWVVAVMVFFAALAGAAAPALHQATGTWHNDLANTVTVEIPPQNPVANDKANHPTRTEPDRAHPGAALAAVLDALQATAGTGPFQVEVRAKDQIMASVRAKTAGTFSLKVPVEAIPATITARNAAGTETRQDITDLSQPVTLSLP